MNFLPMYALYRIDYDFPCIMCYGLNHVPPNSYVEVLIPNVTVFGDRVFREIIKVNKVIRAGPYSKGLVFL